MSTMTFKRRLNGDYPFKRGEILAIAEVCEVPVWFLEKGFDVVVMEEARRSTSGAAGGDNRDPVELAGELRAKDAARARRGQG